MGRCKQSQTIENYMKNLKGKDNKLRERERENTP